MIADNLHTILSKLPSGVSLVAVSKFHPIAALMEAYDAGQRIFAESRPQELAAKVPKMPADVQWHFIGHLQTNKLKLVLPHVTLVQSVDSLHLMEAISAWAVANNRTVDVLLELHLGAEETKQGFSEEEIMQIVCGKVVLSQTVASRPLPDCRRASPTPVGPSPLSGRGWPEVCEKLRFPPTIPGIRLRGLMGMATNTEDMAVVERDFERIEGLFKRMQAMNLPDFDILSIGMSGDWPVAVKHGATMVRIGTDIFGPREY
ncbi:MAG: YggS family pyridoxal phosphate enzyme [Bacteroidales bacterium]|nr:YggS family pyridoxal phosphate enzyme [Bacteroidales bacterium]